jgi:hypothetical protein
MKTLREDGALIDVEGEQKPMTFEEHKQWHANRHRALDELIGDWLRHRASAAEAIGLADLSVMELARWSCEQMHNPTDPPAR